MICSCGALCGGFEEAGLEQRWQTRVIDANLRALPKGRPKMDVFDTIAALVSRFRDLGANRIFYKPLAENDNSKQQIYLGGSFGTLTYFPYGAVRAEPGLKEPTFKAALQFHWVGPGTIEKAPGAQLILYPRYPEVRLSGFLAGCKTAPSSHLQPIPRQDRKGVDGRILFFGTTSDGLTLAHLAPAGSALSREALLTQDVGTGLFQELSIFGTQAGDSRSLVIQKLREIQLMGPVPSMRLDRSGNRIAYKARNGGGYTLEALLGIRPNGDAAPDYLGWEIKAFSGSHITVMTPEPDGGFYGENGVGAFVKRYGREIAGKDQMYFTGRHYFGKADKTTSMTLGLVGFDAVDGTITDVAGRIVLTDSEGTEGASWSYSHLLTHWNRKHSSAAYVPYLSEQHGLPAYTYINPILLGEQTDFSRYLRAIANGSVVFDPGSKIDGVNSTRPRVKARSQFRVGRRRIGCLYERFEEYELGTVCSQR